MGGRSTGWGWGEREKQRQTETEAERQTGRQSDTERHTEKERVSEERRDRDRQRHRESEQCQRWTDGQADGQSQRNETKKKTEDTDHRQVPAQLSAHCPQRPLWGLPWPCQGPLLRFPPPAAGPPGPLRLVPLGSSPSLQHQDQHSATPRPTQCNTRTSMVQHHDQHSATPRPTQCNTITNTVQHQDQHSATP